MDIDEKKHKQYVLRRSITDLTMGILYSAMGIFFGFKDIMGWNFDFPPSPFSYFFGGLCLIYGVFRIYRGVKKEYFN
jgi:uncharacterized membrane protein HdeD (DUF308 family)